MIFIVKFVTFLRCFPHQYITILLESPLMGSAHERCENRLKFYNNY